MTVTRPLHKTLLSYLKTEAPDDPLLPGSPEWLHHTARRFPDGVAGLVTRAVKASPAAAVTGNLAQAGMTAFDVASPAEIALVRSVVPDAVLHCDNPIRSVAGIAMARGSAGDDAGEPERLAAAGADLPSGHAVHQSRRLGGRYRRGGAHRAAGRGHAGAARCRRWVPVAADAGGPPAAPGHLRGHRHASALRRGCPGPFVRTRARNCGRGRLARASRHGLRGGSQGTLGDGVRGALAERPLTDMTDRITAIPPRGRPRTGPSLPRAFWGPTRDSPCRILGEVGLPPSDLEAGDRLLLHGIGARSAATPTRSTAMAGGVLPTSAGWAEPIFALDTAVPVPKVRPDGPSCRQGCGT